MPTRRSIPGLGGLILFLALAGVLPGQRSRTREYPVAPLAITEREAAIGAEMEYREETQSRDGVEAGYANQLFQEYVRYHLHGYSYHPRLLDIDLKLKLALAQFHAGNTGDIDYGEDSASAQETLEDYELKLYFLKEHPISAYLFTSRREYPVLGFFSNFYLVETETRRLGITWKYTSLPMSLSYTERELSKRGGPSNTDIHSEFIEYTLKHYYGQAMRSEARFLHHEYRQRISSNDDEDDPDDTNRYDSDEANFINTTYFSFDKRSNLTSLFRYYDQSADQDLKTYFWRERLRWQHSDTLRSYLQASTTQNEYSQREVDTHRFEAGLNHKLFESLESHVDLHGRQTEYDPITENQYGATGSLKYRKETPWGELSAHYERTIDQFERNGEQRTIDIVNEVHSLGTGGTRFLRNENVIPESVRVTNLQRNSTFSNGFDYVVVESGNRVGIRALPGGRITPGTSVSVDYRYRIDFDFEYISDDEEFYLRHDFLDILDGLAIYGRLHSLEPRDSNDPDRELLDYNDRMAGFELDWKPLRWREEYEQHRSNYNSWNQWRNSLEGTHSLNSRLKFTWSGGVNLTEYDEELSDTGEDSTTAQFLTGRLDGQVGQGGFWSFQGRMEKEEGIVDQTIYGMLARVGYDWRKSTFELGAQYDVREYEDSERENTKVFLQIERKW